MRPFDFQTGWREAPPKCPACGASLKKVFCHNDDCRVLWAALTNEGNTIYIRRRISDEEGAMVEDVTVSNGWLVCKGVEFDGILVASEKEAACGA